MNLEEAKAKLEKYGQMQVLRYYDELDDAQKEALLAQIDATDMSIQENCAHQEELGKRGVISPLTCMEIPEIKPRSIYKLDDNFSEAIKMAERMKKIEKALPGVNCSACGAPSCAALAEDIVRGDAKMDTCILINRRSQASEDAIRSIWGDRVRTKEINNDDTNNL